MAESRRVDLLFNGLGQISQTLIGPGALRQIVILRWLLEGRGAKCSAVHSLMWVAHRRYYPKAFYKVLGTVGRECRDSRREQAIPTQTPRLPGSPQRLA